VSNFLGAVQNPRGFLEVGKNKQLLIAIVPVAQVKQKSIK